MLCRHPEHPDHIVHVPLCQGLELGLSLPHQPYIALLHVH